MNRALVVLLCVALVSASPLHKLQAQIGQRSGAAATDMALASSGPTLDPNMVLDPSQDSVADQYPLTFNQYTACYNVPASDVITTSVDGPEYPWNYYGWYYDAPSTCGGNTRQIVLNDRLPGAASPRHVPANTTRATWWGITPEQYDQANMLDPYTGLSPYLPNGQPLKVLIWLNGAIDFDLEYVIYLNKIASSRGWLVRSIANHWGDFTWKYATPPNDWGQEALIQGYRVKDAQAAIQLLIEQNSDPTHPYYGKIDLAHIYLAGHSAGGAACFQAWKGSSAFLDIAPIANVAGVLPSLDPAMWMYNYTDVESLFGDVLYAGLWSEEQIRTQGWFGLHWANQNTLLNNHLIIKHMCHDMFQTSDCQLNLLAVITDSLSRTYDWAASGLSSQNYCLSPPDDKFLGPELPKAHLQDVANVIMLWMDRVIDAIELSAVTYSNIAYQVLFR